MLIVQLTDIHIGFDGPDKFDRNAARFEKAIAHINALSVKPDLILATGDLIEGGNGWAYGRAKALLEKIDIPQYYTMGNHDDRDAFEAVFKTGLMENGFLNFTIEDYDLRIIVVDTLQEGLHGGAFCEYRADWLSRKLAEQPKRPTLIAMHHPPIDTGIGWLTASPEDNWVKRFKTVIEPHTNIVQIIAGHIHRNITQRFAHTYVTVAQPIAPKVALNLAPIDPDIPDNRVLLTDAIGGYCLHQWKEGSLTTHFVNISNAEPILRYDQDHAWIVRHALDMDY